VTAYPILIVVSSALLKVEPNTSYIYSLTFKSLFPKYVSIYSNLIYNQGAGNL
jgi:hypothetical protein